MKTLNPANPENNGTLPTKKLYTQEEVDALVAKNKTYIVKQSTDDYTIKGGASVYPELSFTLQKDVTASEIVAFAIPYNKGYWASIPISVQSVTIEDNTCTIKFQAYNGGSSTTTVRYSLYAIY